jgi:hypothetical protein
MTMNAITRLSRSIARHRVRTAGITAAVLAIAAVVVIVSWPNSATTTPIAYTNISRNYKTCLITTTGDATQAAPMWKAIQTATTRAPINAQQLIPPTGTTAELLPYFNSLLALHCQLVVAAGPDLTDALTATATANPRVHFLDVGATNVSKPNVHHIAQADPNAITSYVLGATRGRY